MNWAGTIIIACISFAAGYSADKVEILRPGEQSKGPERLECPPVWKGMPLIFTSEGKSIFTGLRIKITLSCNYGIRE